MKLKGKNKSKGCLRGDLEKSAGRRRELVYVVYMRFYVMSLKKRKIVEFFVPGEKW
jgi:hypothetical protein